MTPLIGETVRDFRADVLLVSLGLIDLGFYTNAEQTNDNVRAFVAAARSANPRIRVAVLPVLHNIRVEADPSFAEQVAHFNELLAKTTTDLDDPGSPLLLVPPPAAYDFHTDTYDGTHPNESGEHRIAEAFATAMDEEWGLGGPYSPPRRPPGSPGPAGRHRTARTGRSSSPSPARGRRRARGPAAAGDRRAGASGPSRPPRPWTGCHR
ncbi:hypothetical protein STENM327S_00506 [Streptomyces tendae]